MIQMYYQEGSPHRRYNLCLLYCFWLNILYSNYPFKESNKSIYEKVLLHIGAQGRLAGNCSFALPHPTLPKTLLPASSCLQVMMS